MKKLSFYSFFFTCFMAVPLTMAMDDPQTQRNEKRASSTAPKKESLLKKTLKKTLNKIEEVLEIQQPEASSKKVLKSAKNVPPSQKAMQQAYMPYQYSFSFAFVPVCPLPRWDPS